MVGKPKALQRPKKNQQQKSQPLNTADDFQEAADLEENTGGKWRAGDQAKSGRAFLRAIDIYNNGLVKFPGDFDLAYNKARLELELSQQPAIVAKLPISLIQLLHQALASHRHALRLNQDSVDVLFNSAQVLTCLAEIVIDDPRNPSIQVDPANLLREVLELLNACFDRQQTLLEEQTRGVPNHDSGDDHGGVPLDPGASQQQAIEPPRGERDATEEQSVVIEQPITASDLLDTALATLHALRLLVSVDDPANLAKVSSMASTLITNTIPQCVAQLNPDERSEAESEISLESATFAVATANAQYLANQLPLSAYAANLDAFQALDLQHRLGAVCTYADSLSEMTTAVLVGGRFRSAGGTSAQESSSEGPQLLWTALTRAQSLYSVASKLQSSPELTAERKAQIYQSRGDVELLRHRICTMPQSSSLSEIIIQQAPQLVKNAITFYKAAANHFRALGDSDTAAKATMRELVATVIGNPQEAEKLKQQMSSNQQLCEIVVREMMDEGCIEPDWGQ